MKTFLVLAFNGKYEKPLKNIKKDLMPLIYMSFATEDMTRIGILVLQSVFLLGKKWAGSFFPRGKTDWGEIRTCYTAKNRQKYFEV